MTRIDRERPEPLYHQLEVLLRARILSGEWPAESRIPTEQELCDAYQVSRVTARQAIRNLVEGGYLVRRAGLGTFVTAPLLTAGERGLKSFSEEMRALSLRPGATLLELKEADADQAELERLELPVGSRVVRIKRLRTGDGRPIGLQHTRLPAARFPDLEAVDLADRSLYELLEQRFGVVVAEARETFWVSKVPAEDAGILQVDRGVCAFRVERVAMDATGVPIEFTTSLMRGDRYKIHWVLKGGTVTRSSQEGRIT
ncbi:MAG TPA: GntR family transcriptional regulator [Trueperaceae bacterium]|nr:GntR family transcriptional regulator [Trueperaceae bacterium]